MSTKKKAAPSGNGNPHSIGVHGKGKDFTNQKQRVYLSLLERPKTMLEVSIETGILRANICRYVGKMRKIGQVAVARHGLCPVSKFRAGFLTTDSDLFPCVPPQQTSFGGRRNE